MTRITRIFGLEKLRDTNPNMIVCEFPEERECVGNCKKPYTPTDADRSTRRPSCYFKSCFGCREKSKIRTQDYLAKKKFNTALEQQAVQADH